MATASSNTSIHVLDAILPALNLAKAGVTGIGIPGVEPAVNGVLELATMLSVMKANKEDLSKLETALNKLIAIDATGASGDLKGRLGTLATNLKPIAAECKSLAGKGRFQRFFSSKEYKEKIQDIRNLITSHIQEFIFYGNISIEKLVGDMLVKVRLIDDKVDTVLANNILDKLRCVPARYNAENTPDKCMEGTRVDIIQDIIARLTGAPHTSQRLVMLSGPAGSGKSTIAKSVATILAEEKGVLAASFFFSRDYTERKEIRHLSTTLARQLADYDPVYHACLIEVLHNDRSGILSAEPHLQFHRLIVDVLEQMPLSHTPWIICLDALDECGKDRGQIFFRLLSDSITRIPAHIRFFLTGRPDVPSYLKFDTLRSLMYGIILDEVDTSIVTHDIHLYVEQSLDGSTWTTRNPWKAQSHDVDDITQRAGGLFVFAATAVRYILAGLPQVQPQKSVDHLLRGAPLTHLRDLYHRIVDEAIPQPTDDRDHEAHAIVMKVLGTIFQLFEPLDPKSLAALLNIDIEDLRGILLPLNAVIRVPDNPGGTIQIIHISFREFMTADIQKTRSDLLCGTEYQQNLVASNLLDVMHSKLRFNICNLPTSYLKNVEVADILLRLDTHVPGHLRYSCRFWMDHLAVTSYNSASAQAVEKLLFQQFLFWLEVMSLLSMVGHASQSLSKLILWANKDPAIIHFATDGKRFISFFADAIMQSAPHIYISALALAPIQSQVRKIFCPQFPQLLSISRGQMISWPPIMAVLEGHTHWVMSVAFSRNGKYIVSGSTDTTARIWDVESGNQLGGPLMGHSGQVLSVAFSPNGRCIVSSSSDHTIRMWDADSGETIGLLEGHTAGVTSVAFSLDGKHIVSGSADRTVRIWGAEYGESVGRPFKGHTDQIQSVAFSPDGKHIVSGSSDTTIRIWNTESGDAVGDPLYGHTSSVESVAFSPDGKQIVSGSSDNTLRVWNTESRVAHGPFKGHTNRVQSVAFSSDGKYIVSGSWDKTVCLWDPTSGKAVGRPFKGHTHRIQSVAFSPDGRYIVSGSGDHTVCVWHMDEALSGENSGAVVPLEGHALAVNSVAFSPDGKHIVSGSGDHAICIWDAQTGKVVGKPFEGHCGRVHSVTFSQDGKNIVSGSDDKTIRLWDTQSGREVCKPLEGHTHWVQSVAFSPDGTHIASASFDQTVCVWERENDPAFGKPLEGGDWIQHCISTPGEISAISHSDNIDWATWDAHRTQALGGPLEGHAGRIYSVAFSPDGKYIVSVSDDKSVQVWDTQSWKLWKSMEGHTDWVQSVAFSPDGKHIVSGSFDNTIRVWDMNGGKALCKTLTGHTHCVQSVAFSPDGKYIVSGADDNTVRIWNTGSGEPLGPPFEGHTRRINSVAFSPDGQHFVSGSDDHTVRVWCTQPSIDSSGPRSIHHSGPGLLKSLHVQHPSVPPHWKVENGWISCIPGEPLFWLPSHNRVGLWLPHNTLVIGRQQTLLSYDNFVHGTEWMNCYIGTGTT